MSQLVALCVNADISVACGIGQCAANSALGALRFSSLTPGCSCRASSHYGFIDRPESCFGTQGRAVGTLERAEPHLAPDLGRASEGSEMATPAQAITGLGNGACHLNLNSCLCPSVEP